MGVVRRGIRRGLEGKMTWRKWRKGERQLIGERVVVKEVNVSR